LVHHPATSRISPRGLNGVTVRRLTVPQSCKFTCLYLYCLACWYCACWGIRPCLVYFTVQLCGWHCLPAKIRDIGKAALVPCFVLVEPAERMTCTDSWNCMWCRLLLLYICCLLYSAPAVIIYCYWFIVLVLTAIVYWYPFYYIRAGCTVSVSLINQIVAGRKCFASFACLHFVLAALCCMFT
jgi:hypothetical protein